MNEGHFDEENNPTRKNGQSKKLRFDHVPRTDNYVRESHERESEERMDAGRFNETKKIQPTTKQFEPPKSDTARFEDSGVTRKESLEEMKAKYEAMSQQEKDHLRKVLYEGALNKPTNISNLMENTSQVNPSQMNPSQANPGQVRQTDLTESQLSFNVSSAFQDNISNIQGPQTQNPSTSKNPSGEVSQSVLKKSRPSINEDDEYYEDDFELSASNIEVSKKLRESQEDKKKKGEEESLEDNKSFSANYLKDIDQILKANRPTIDVNVPNTRNV